MGPLTSLGLAKYISVFMGIWHLGHKHLKCFLFFHLLAVQIYAAKQAYPTNTDVTFLAVAEETPAEFLWHFGDSSSSRTTSRSITKRYNKPGRYRTKTALWKGAVSVNSHHLKSVNCNIFPHQDVSFLFDAGMMSLWSCFGAGPPSPLTCSRCCFRERWSSTGCSISRPCCSTKPSHCLVGSLPAPMSASCGALETDLPGLETAPNTTPSTSELIFKVAQLTFLWSLLVYILCLKKKYIYIFFCSSQMSIVLTCFCIHGWSSELEPKLAALSVMATRSCKTEVWLIAWEKTIPPLTVFFQEIIVFWWVYGSWSVWLFLLMFVLCSSSHFVM